MPALTIRRMPPRHRPHFKPQRQPTFLRAWREHRGMNQERFVEALDELTGYTLSISQLSRIETGKQEWSQDFLEAAATILQCDIPDLLRIDPKATNRRYSILDGLTERQIKRVARIVEAVREEDDEERGTGS